MINIYPSVLICAIAFLFPLMEGGLLYKLLGRKATAWWLSFILILVLFLGGGTLLLGLLILHSFNNSIGYFHFLMLVCLVALVVFHIGVLISFLFYKNIIERRDAHLT